MFWIELNHSYETDESYQPLVEIQIERSGKFRKIYPNIQQHYSRRGNVRKQYIFTTHGRYRMHQNLKIYINEKNE